MPSCLAPGHFGNRLGDVGVSAATADVAAHPLAHLDIRKLRRRRQVRADVAWDALLDFVQHCDRRTDLPRRTIAALVAVVFDESGLHRVKAVGSTQSFDGCDLVALVHDGEGEARIDANPIHDHGAGPALTVVATLLRAGEMNVLA